MHDLQHSAAAERNRQPILDALRQLLPAQGEALEIASGSGQHVAWFAAALPGWTWQSSDVQADAFDSIEWWCAEAGVKNIAAPVMLDVLALPWPTDGAEFSARFDLIYCANMLHIAPWPTCAGLMRGAARYLDADGMLITYGPYLERDVPTAQGNAEFDLSLRESNPDWGIRSLDAVTQQAALAGLRLQARMAMPSNNLLLIFKRAERVHTMAG